MRKALFWAALLGLIGALAGFGCSATSSRDNDNDDSGSGAASGVGGSGGGDGCTFGCDTSGSSMQGVPVISPANPVLNVEAGNVPTQAFTVTMNGGDVTGQVVWTFERPDIGDIAAASTFTPTGTVGGMGKLTARLGTSEASTNVTVYVKKVVNTAGIDPVTQIAFDSPSGGVDPSLSVVYPYNETVFPLDVLGPEIQWNGGQAGDIYRLKITEKYYEYTEYLTAAPPARHLMPEADWKSIEESGSGAQSDPVKFELTRKSGPLVFLPVQQTWHIAQGRLKGSVYYWELPDQCANGSLNGRILRIKASSPTPDEFFTPGGCWGCHTVSRDGLRMAAEFNDGNGPLYTVNLGQNPAMYGEINPGAPSGNYVFSAYNNDGTKLLASENNSRQLQVVDAISGDVLNPSVLGSSCGEPAWSPDGTKVAGICNLSGGGWTFDSYQGDLLVGTVGADGVTVSNPTTIVPQAAGQGRPAYPSFSPGSEWIAFGRPTEGSRSAGYGDLWIVRPDGAEMKQLAAASNDNRSFNPVFAPLRAGGYFWLVFISPRDYGNTLVGASRQQLWVTAISDPPTAADPSHPPFYLRGQEPCAKSENAYYALDPCKAVGEGCVTGVDCCNGQCVKDPSSGVYVCGEQSGCSDLGNGCTTAADCCEAAAQCVDGFCQLPPPE